MNKQTFSNLVLFPIQVPIQLPRIVFLISILPVGVHVKFDRKVPQDLQCFPRISAPYVWPFRFGNFQKFWSIIHFYLGVSRYCVSCLSLAPWQSGYDIHHFCGSHLERRRALFSTNCVSSRVVFYNVSPEHDPFFVLLQLWFQLRHS